MASLALNDVLDRSASVPDHFVRETVHGNVLQMQEEDRHRISRELHDDFGQRFALLEIQLSHLADNCACTDTLTGLRSARAMIGEMDHCIHRICYQLYPVLLEHLGLIAALKSLCDEFSQLGLRIEFMHEKCPAIVPEALSLCLYRVVQEALHNTLKHAKVKRAKVSLRGSSGRLGVVIEDSGIGFDPSLLGGKAGLGLISIQERVRGSGGRSSICSVHGVGTAVRAVLPTAIVVD
jgi:signal transduction histidine kinase